MSTYVKFEQFIEDMGRGVHDLAAAGDTLKVYLTNTAPVAATDAVKADITGITEQNGYAAADVQNDYSQTDGVATLSGTDVTWTASGGPFGPFRYVVMYNDTTTVKAAPLICYWDYGSSITISDGESFTADIGASLATFQ